MFRIDNLSYAYPGRESALRGLSARVPEGVTLLVGPNAGGKTTLLRLLAGLLEPAAGGVVDAGNGAPLAPSALRRIGRMVMQDAEPQILGARVGEDIMLGQAASALGPAFGETARRLADKLGLGGFWHDSVEALSYGQKRKLCLVHALAAGPRTLLLDEPFAGLDYPSARELRAFIREHRARGLTQIISTHELEPVFDLADWAVVIADGRAVAEGPPEAVRTQLPAWSVRPPGGGWE